MQEILVFITFFIFSIFILIKCISYGLYEIKTEKNKTAGITVIVFSIFSVVLSNFAIFIN